MAFIASANALDINADIIWQTLTLKAFPKGPYASARSTTTGKTGELNKSTGA